MKTPTLAVLKPSRRRRTPAPEQARWAKAWEHSQQTQQDFAQDHGLSVATLRNWIRRYQGHSVRERGIVEFQEVDLGKLMRPEVTVRSIAWEAEIRLPSGVTIAVAHGTAAARVRELMEAVRC